MFNEIAKLICGLSAKNIPFELNAQGYLNGIQVKCADWDAVCNDMSYGHEQGLLEVMGSISVNPDDVEGWLTADDILARLQALFYLTYWLRVTGPGAQYFPSQHTTDILSSIFL